MPDTNIETTNIGSILVAEDDLNLGMLWEQLLEKAGYDVKRTTNKADALAAFQPGIHALALLDLQMPSARGRGINTKAGLETAREMRRLDPGVPVLLLTASGDEEAETDMLRLPGVGKNAFTRKPCGKTAILERVRQMAEMARLTRFAFGPCAVINKSTRAVMVAGDRNPRHLSPQVLDLAVVFARNKGAALPRVELARQWGWEEASLDECIRKLREAVNDNERTIIKTIHGTGYVYNPQG